MRDHLIITCEHGGHEVPEAFAHLFAGQEETLRSHRGWDPGSLELGEEFSRRFHAPFFSATVTRLLVELNRSLGHPRLFSEFAAPLGPVEQNLLLDTFYRPYRREIEEAMAEAVEQGRRVVHVSMHSFTPVLNDEVRTADIGLLYDPARLPERRLCETWQQTLRTRRSELRVRRNYPYLGTSDGFTTALRGRFPAERYLGIELEVNQRFPLGDRAMWERLRHDLIESFAQAWGGGERRGVSPTCS